MSDTIIGVVGNAVKADIDLAAQFPGGVYRLRADNSRPEGAFLVLVDENNEGNVYTSTNRVATVTLDVAIYDTTAASVTALMETWQSWFNEFTPVFGNLGFLPNAKLIQHFTPAHESTDIAPKNKGQRLYCAQVTHKCWLSFSVR